MKIIGIIPSRFASTRFPGKPLIDIAGKSMIQRVYEQASKAKSLDRVIVATDDVRIRDHVNSFKGNVIMTSNDHLNGTERCNEVIHLQSGLYDYAINIQGDEPMIHPEMIDQLAAILDGKTELGTLVKKIENIDLLTNTNVMKVTFNLMGEALYFSRNCIPHVRGAELNTWLTKHDFYKHIGIYAYRVDILKEITALSQGVLEMAESLEQLRWLENGYRIKVAKTTYESHGVDTPEDLVKLERMIEDGKA